MTVEEFRLITNSWVIDPNRRHVKVTNSEGGTKLYHCGEEIPLSLFANASLAVDSIVA